MFMIFTANQEITSRHFLNIHLSIPSYILNGTDPILNYKIWEKAGLEINI